MHKCLILYKPSVTSYSLPYLWASVKTYYEENSEYATEWAWPFPNLDYSTVDSIVAQVIDLNPTVVGFSMYVWNEKLFRQVAEKVKQINKDIIIVFGGPQSYIKYDPDFFKEYSFVDLVIPGDAYGEIIWKEILDSISVNNGKLNSKDIPYSYFSSADQRVVFNDKPIDKKGFKWPQNIFKAQEKELLGFIPVMKRPIWALVETSRGCPYKCSFCDWGGGTYTKTNKKDFNIVLSELEWLAKNQFDAIYISDANFGLFDIDIEYTRQLVKLKKTYGYPKRVLIQPTKSKLENLFTIYKLLSEVDLIFQYTVAVEDINDHVLKNIDRVDFSFDEKMDMCKRLQDIKYMPIMVEGILGLPGSSLDTVKSDIKRIISHDLQFPINHIWMLLPETPAYTKEYRDKFKLITVKDKDYTGINTYPLKLKKNFTADPGIVYNVDSDQNTTEFVVGTMSYSIDEWIKMHILQILVATTYNTGILKLIPKFMYEIHEVEYGEFYAWVMEDIFLNQETPNKLHKVKDAIEKWVNGDSKNIYCEYSDDFPYQISPSNYIIFIILNQTDLFFNQLSDLLYQKTQDDRVYDLCSFMENRLISIDYVPGKKFSVEYDWLKFEQTNHLHKQQKRYIINDNTILVGGVESDIDWDLHPDNRLPHFLYRVCYDIKDSKLARQLTEIPENLQ